MAKSKSRERRKKEEKAKQRAEKTTKGQLPQRIVPVSCMPRSGSTLLMNLLGQCPRHHVTPTNDLVSLMLAVRDRWIETPGFQSQGLIKNIKPRVAAGIRGLLQGFYEQELEKGKTVFDKSRGWIHHLGILEEVFNRQLKVLATVRDVRDVVASMEKVHRQSLLTERRPFDGEAFFDHQTVYGRARLWLAKDGVIGQYIAGLRDALHMRLGDRIQIIPYHALTRYPAETMNSVHEFLGFAPFGYDPEHVDQITEEDDSVHGMVLHVIRPKVEPQDKPGWLGVLPKDLTDKLAEEYKDINDLADIGD